MLIPCCLKIITTLNLHFELFPGNNITSMIRIKKVLVNALFQFLLAGTRKQKENMDIADESVMHCFILILQSWQELFHI